jgi:uncharacterized integral membrane protein
MLSVDEQVIINKVKRNLQSWHSIRFILLLILIAIIITEIVFVIDQRSMKYPLFCLILSSLIGSTIGIIIRNWNGSKKDLLLIKLYEELNACIE